MEEADSMRFSAQAINKSKPVALVRPSFRNLSNEPEPMAAMMPSFPTENILELFEKWMAYDSQRNAAMREMQQKLDDSNNVAVENKVLAMQLEIYKQDFLQEKKEREEENKKRDQEKKHREMAQLYIKQLEEKYNAMKLEFELLKSTGTHCLTQMSSASQDTS